jgi:hypothetical protein
MPPALYITEQLNPWQPHMWPCFGLGPGPQYATAAMISNRTVPAHSIIMRENARMGQGATVPSSQQAREEPLILRCVLCLLPLLSMLLPPLLCMLLLAMPDTIRMLFWGTA